MSTFIKSLVVAAALASGALAVTSANAMNAACQGGSFTQHGIWDCR
jgi:hypothetical protein